MMGAGGGCYRGQEVNKPPRRPLLPVQKAMDGKLLEEDSSARTALRLASDVRAANHQELHPFCASPLV